MSVPPKRGGLDYKWIAVSNTVLGILMATINSSILLIALPDIFRASRWTRSPQATRPTSCGS